LSKIVEWLSELGLEKYISNFADAEVDFETLSELERDDLTELGLPLGPRRKIWGAIKRLEEADTSAIQLTEGLQKPAIPIDAERRQLTVMFCDVSGSTAMSEMLDPEELRDVMLAYQEVCVNAIQQFGGHVAKYLGDGVLAYFGYPTAHEDDPSRSVRAGLALLASVQDLNVKLRQNMNLEIGVRIGIHTGLVVAGEMGAGDVRESDAIVGETPNIAARLEGLADSGGMVIGPVTHRLIKDEFECNFLGEKLIKGISKPIPIYSVENERSASEVISHIDSRPDNQFIGRKEELGHLKKLWGMACNGDGQLAFVSGEAGVGKSKLSREFVRQVSTGDISTVYLQGSALHKDNPLYPLKNYIQSIANIDPTANSDIQSNLLENWGAEHSLSLGTSLPAIFNLLSIPEHDPTRALTGNPQFKKRAIESALMQVMAAIALSKPLMLLVEDAHWIDPSTLDWITQFVSTDVVPEKLVLVTARAHLQNPWQDNNKATTLALDRLDQAAASEVIRSIFKGKDLPAMIVSQLLDKADGVPLFIEELSKSVRDSKALIERDHEYVLSNDVALTIPASLQDLLTARLDQLELGKGVAQIGSAFGRHFAGSMIKPISTLDEPSLLKAFEQLLASDLVEVENDLNSQSLYFRHALMRDAAYESMLKSRRKELHKQIADLIDAQYQGTSQYEPAEIASHRHQAGQFEDAIMHWKQAAQMALEKGANIEAINQLQQALHCIEKLPPGPKTNQLELGLQCMIGPALMATKGWGASEPHVAFQRARILCEEVGDQQQSFAALWGIWLFHAAGSDLKNGLDLVGELFRIADTEKDEALELQAHHAAWGTRCWFGDMDVAIKHVERGLELYDHERHRDHASRYGGHDPGVCAHAQGALTFWYRGFPDTALRRALRGIEFAHELNHPPSIGHAQLWLCNLLFQRRERPQLAKAAAELNTFAQQHALGQYQDQANLFSTWANTFELGVDTAIESHLAGLARNNSNGLKGLAVFRHYMLAEINLAAGRLNEASIHVDGAFELIAAPEPHVITADLFRLKCAIEYAKPNGNLDTAMQFLHEGLAVTKNQNAKSFELRVCTDMARIFLREDGVQAAYEALSPIHDWFTEGFDTVDWNAAQELRVEIAGASEKVQPQP
jgi:class 3 adenylate cyclase/predicted ATPase